jgi:hypothetical protein
MLYVTKLEFKTPNIQEQIANYEKQYKKYFSVIVEGNEPYYETFKNMLYSHIK